jgi:hypothetical protein
MRSAKGSADRPGRMQYPARFTPDIFQIVTDFAARTGSSFNQALADLIQIGAGRSAASARHDHNDPVIPSG